MLEVAEHDREIALREELVRQEKLEQLAAKFKRKADLRDSWMKETAQMLDSQADFGSDVASTQAAIKKEDTIDTEVHAFEERLATLGNLCTQLVGESYCKAADIQSRYDGTKQEWNHLTETMAARRKRLTEAYQLQKVGVYFGKKKNQSCFSDGHTHSCAPLCFVAPPSCARRLRTLWRQRSLLRR